MNKRRIPMDSGWKEKYYKQVSMNEELRAKLITVELEHKNLKAKLEEQKEILKEQKETIYKLIPIAFPDATKKMIELTQSIAKTIKESGIYE